MESSAHGRTGIFDDVAGAAGGADDADDGKHHVLGCHADREVAFNRDTHVFGMALSQRLGRQNMLDLRRADAKGQGAKGAVGGGVAVAADDGHAGLGEALFGPDDMHDALTGVVHLEQVDAEFLALAVSVST